MVPFTALSSDDIVELILPKKNIYCAPGDRLNVLQVRKKIIIRFSIDVCKLFFLLKILQLNKEMYEINKEHDDLCKNLKKKKTKTVLSLRDLLLSLSLLRKCKPDTIKIYL